MKEVASSKVKKEISSAGISLVGVVQVVFLVLKLFKVINWSWFWVLFPTILDCSLSVLLLILIGIYALCFISKESD